MSISVPITNDEIKLIKKELKKDQDFVCLDKITFIKVNLVGLNFPHLVKAKIVKGF